MNEIEKKGCVYFFKHVGLKPIKIGYTNNESPLNRFIQFSTYAPFGSQIVGFISTNEANLLEKTLHDKFAEKRLLGEWFDISETECENVINFYSNIEDIKDKNDFQIEWAKKKEQKKAYLNMQLNNNNKDYTKDKILKLYINNPKIKKTELCKLAGVTRKTIYDWINELNKFDMT
jgi:hypothetical protein